MNYLKHSNIGPSVLRRKKVGENRDKFYLSPTVGQNVVVSFTHANVSWPTQVGQQKEIVL